MRPNPVDLVGQTIFGQYKIVRKLGEGGMGAVYQARQEAIGQDLAIKVLLAEAAQSDELVKRFQREARVISMLAHQNIIRAFVFGSTDTGQLYMAMEFVNGHELRERLRGEPMDELTTIRIMKQCCSALAEAHDLGIVHRDLKPDNILLTEFRGEKNFVKILDFGIAKITSSEGGNEAKLTQAGIVYGTPEYLSPEQAQALELDNRTDIYSLGVMLYEMMTGRVPFYDDSPVKILTKHVFEEPAKPSAMRPGITPTMENIILKAMAKDRDARFSDAMEMYKALVMREQELLSSRGMSADANWVPGSELTGMFQAISAPDPAWAGGGGVTADPRTTPLAQGVNVHRPKPQQQPGGGAKAPEPTETISRPEIPAAPAPDPTRKLILGVIAVGIVILIILLVVIVALLMKGGG